MLDKHEDLLPKEIYWLLQEAESYSATTGCIACDCKLRDISIITVVRVRDRE
jgi:hypothetical protein